MDILPRSKHVATLSIGLVYKYYEIRLLACFPHIIIIFHFELLYLMSSSLFCYLTDGKLRPELHKHPYCFA